FGTQCFRRQGRFGFLQRYLHQLFGIILTDSQQRILEFNLSAERIFGHSRQEIQGRQVIELVPPDRKDVLEAGFRRHLETGESPVPDHVAFETTALHKSGAIFPVRLAVNRIMMGDAPSCLAMVIDISEEKRLTSELIQSERMAALGNMVAGVAHEINTPVGIGITASSELEDRIRMFEQTLRHEGISEEELETHISFAGRMVELIRINLERAADLVRCFKAVAVEHSSGTLRSFMVRECFESAFKLYHADPNFPRLTIHLDCPEALEMQSYPDALIQVILNLLSNSRIHAYRPDEEGHITIECQVSGEHLLFSYGDDGSGMIESVRNRIFDPFFTTNRQHGGTGLGMHVVYNLVTKTLGGSISCQSAPGQGTRFLIKIPFTILRCAIYDANEDQACVQTTSECL
ncbi:MAG: PAS domain S-box protein, partial [Magnetococcales bacterium]|nr:PAS domain S-box protein [Magnetococcales bacterium]